MSSILAQNTLPAVLLFLAFLVGSLPFGLMTAQIFKVREFRRLNPKGSVRRHLIEIAGFWPAGALNLLVDFLKGVIPVFLFTPLGYRFLSVFVRDSIDLTSIEENAVLLWSSGLCVILGHCFSPWLQFRGGRAVVSTFGVISVLSPLSALFGALGFGLIFVYSSITALASVGGLISATVSYVVLNNLGLQHWFGLMMIFVVLLRHDSNIDALLEKREPKFVFKP